MFEIPTLKSVKVKTKEAKQNKTAKIHSIEGKYCPVYFIRHPFRIASTDKTTTGPLECTGIIDSYQL